MTSKRLLCHEREDLVSFWMDDQLGTWEYAKGWNSGLLCAVSVCKNCPAMFMFKSGGDVGFWRGWNDAIECAQAMMRKRKGA